jgi:DNA-3-methyladenine glycosylase II
LIKDIVRVPRDYNFSLNYDFLRRSTREILHAVEGSGIHKAILLDDVPLLISLTPIRRTFEITYPAERPGKKRRDAAVKYVREWLDLDTDLAPFYDFAKTDKLLKGPVENYYGYRIVGMPDLFESLCWAVIGQQINLAFAYTLKQRFVEKFGCSLEWNEKKYYLFPQPEVIASLNDEHLLPLQFSRQKSKYVRLLGEAFRDGVISKASIAALSFSEARQTLMSIKGVGNWTANYALMKTFRYREAFPLEDAGLHNAIKRLKNMAEKPTVEQVRRIFKKYKGWEAYATLYLWKSL